MTIFWYCRFRFYSKNWRKSLMKLQKVKCLGTSNERFLWKFQKKLLMKKKKVSKEDYLQVREIGIDPSFWKTSECKSWKIWSFCSNWYKRWWRKTKICCNSDHLIWIQLLLDEAFFIYTSKSCWCWLKMEMKSKANIRKIWTIFTKLKTKYYSLKQMTLILLNYQEH